MIFFMSLLDQPSPAEITGPDIQSTSSTSTPHPVNVQKPPLPPAHSHPQPPTNPQSTGSLQGHPHVQSQGLSANAHTHVQPNIGLPHSHSMPPPYQVTTEDLNKEDVIFF